MRLRFLSGKLGSYVVVQSHTNPVPRAWWAVAISKLNPSSLKLGSNLLEIGSLGLCLTRFESKNRYLSNTRRRC